MLTSRGARRIGAALVICSIAMAQQPSNHLWATNFAGTTRLVSKINPIGSVELNVSFPGTFTPFGLAVDPGGNIWAASNGNSVAKFDSNGVVAGTFSVGSFPQSVASDSQGNIFVANRSSNSVSKLSNSGTVLGTTALPANTAPIGIIVDQNDHVWVSGFHTNTSTTYSLYYLDNAGVIVSTYTFPTTIGGFGFSFPSVDLNNDVWVGNQGRSSLMQVDVLGNLLSETAVSPGLPRGNEVDGLNYCWIAAQGTGGRCSKVDQSGVVVASYLPTGTFLTTCSIDAYGDPWVFGYSGGAAIKLWEVDATELVRVPLPSGGSAWGGDSGAFHNCYNLNPYGDYDADGYTNRDEIIAGTNPLDIRSTPLNPTPIQSGVAHPGSTVNLGLRVRADANLPYIMAAAVTDTPAIPLGDGRFVPLAYDPLFVLSLQPNPFFVNFVGVLNATGDAKAQALIPNDPLLVGLSFAVAFVTLDPTASLGVRTVSNSTIIAIQ